MNITHELINQLASDQLKEEITHYKKFGSGRFSDTFLLTMHSQKYIVISMSARRNSPQGAKRYAEASLNIIRHFSSTGEIII